ncbi:hypothetical protein [Magnetospirillum sp. 64-120]|uniref:hypothetical protein n=1 Tax=Magnetospirillum sp. 64-120 TaxID=1895778 RepID=UPI0025BE5885|nr:hypothetical protein [Magnetospirillum sp. 64-120]
MSSSPAPLDAPLMTRAVHLADRMGMEWGDFLFLLSMVERYLLDQENGAPPPKDL